ncbi:reverse transcriptase domain-containing protein [Tanacetum coccineum]|uniref:Reverse transcriptase domain-containing protein n=1 Tax=Tanacetum coccineum TaxID=301880 RepID=A0ABQ5CGS4_9ASTR
MPPKRTTTPMTDDAIKQLIAQGVVGALVMYEANRGNGNGDDSHDSRTSGRRHVPNTRECTYSDFLKCQPLNFKGTEGVVGLTQWLEKMESVFHIRYCTVANQVKFATCILLRNALTWWNSHVKTVSHEAAYGMTWKTLKKMMSNKMFPEESDKVEKYVGGLLDNNIQGSVMASKPNTMQDAIEFTNELMDQKVRAYAERQAEKKRKLDNNNQAQQQPPKKQSVAIAYTAGSPAATNNQRTLTCYECGNQGHYRSDCLELKNQNHENQARGTKARGMVYALGRGETNQDLNNMEDDINA